MRLFLFVVLLVSSCTFKKNNQKLKGHDELYSEPSEPKLLELESHEKRIVIASTNDVHGDYAPEKIKLTDQHNPGQQSISIGGKDVMASYFSILRDTYKNVVLVDSGDIFRNGTNVKAIKDFYQSNKYDAVTVGLRDFNLKVSSKIGNNVRLFQKFSENNKVPLLISNLYELKTARGIEWEGTQSHLLKDVDGLKVGIIGLVPDDIVSKTPVNNRVGLFVENMLQSTLRHARLMRSLGADLIVVLTHQGIACGNALADEQKIPLKKVNFDPKREKICDMNSPLGDYLERLPPDLVDVVISGRNHQKTANYINGTLVLSGFPDGMSFNYAEFVIDTKANKIVPEKTIVHQPVMFCSEFFKETNDCFPEDTTVDHKKRIPATFLGKTVTPLSMAPSKEERKTTLNFKHLPQSLKSMGADLSYLPESSGETQLMVVYMKGKELLQVLEEDFNRERKNVWHPYPFRLAGNELSVFVGGSEINLNKNYKILTDIESVQNHRHLLKKMNDLDVTVFMNHSWSSMELDSVSTQMAAQAR